ncbi:MAG TPA: hypothetical protein DCO68_07770 [Methylophilaceae bacterium]|nr:hypothetical protein [Methylophilaceae bacterium]HAJ71964.1 hypothetical protein [Methylophilaceae bacterium]
MHVLVKFALLLALVLVIGWLSLVMLITISAGLALSAWVIDKQKFFISLYRVRWLLFILIITYAFATPGQYLDFWWAWMMPSYEGIEAGVKQALKIITILSGLSILLSTTTQLALIGGLYQFMRLFDILKLDAKKFAVRIWLTLHYFETRDTQREGKRSLMHMFEELEQLDSSRQLSEISMNLATFSVWDKLILLLVLLAIIIVWMQS